MIYKDLNKSVRSKGVSGQVYQIQKGINGGPNDLEDMGQLEINKRGGSLFGTKKHENNKTFK